MNFSSGNFRGNGRQNGKRESSFKFRKSENNLPLVQNYKTWRFENSPQLLNSHSPRLQPMEDTALRLPRTRNALGRSVIVKHKNSADVHNLLFTERNWRTTEPINNSSDKYERNNKENVFQTSEKNGMSFEKSTSKPSQSSNVDSSQKASIVKLRNIADSEVHFTDTIHRKTSENIGCGTKCKGSLMGAMKRQPLKTKEEILTDAEDFFKQYFTSLRRNDTPEHNTRWMNVKKSIEDTGSYHMTIEELTFGAKVGWRNAPRCIGRIQWSNLQVFDARDVTTAKGMFQAICHHIKYATNNGKIRSTITFFRQRTDMHHDFRVWNVHLVMYAGYRQSDGTIIGDPMHVDFTEICMKLGWKGKYGMFDVLPLVVQANGGEPEWFEYPKEIVLEAEITHPKYAGIKRLGLRWYCLPAVANMMFDCGGLQFTASPFNGWYMATEVAARDFCDTHRYNMIEKIATAMNLDTRANPYMWRDQAVVEMNVAILHSFQNVGATIVDHHTASESFMTFMQNEHKQRGGCPADWVWIVPPISGSLTAVFHQEMLLYKLKPSYEYQDEAWKTWQKEKQLLKHGKSRRGISFKTIAGVIFQWITLMKRCMKDRVKCTILFATETGKSENFAKTLYKIFKQNFHARIINMEQYSLKEIRQEELVLFVTSTFGNGDPPENAKKFAKDITTLKDAPAYTNKNGDVFNGRRVQRVQNGHTLVNVKFSVFALGSKAYPQFCAFGRFLDKTVETFGGTRIHGLGEGDELCGQEESFRNWAKKVYQAACNYFKIGSKSSNQIGAAEVLENTDTSWSKGKYRIVAAKERPLPLHEELSRLFRKSICACRLKEKMRLSTRNSSRRTALAKIDIRQHQDTLRYSPGDHVLLYPKNSPMLVKQLIRLLDDAPQANQLIRIERRENDQESSIDGWRSHDSLPVGTVESLLSTYLDITSPPTQEFLSLLSTLAASSEDQTKIKRLVNSTLAYNEWRDYGMPTVPDTIKMFKSLRVPTAFLLTQLPHLQPRYYSISSSLDACPGEIHVTFDVIEYQTQDGSMHKGVCSNYLNDLPIGEDIMCSVRIAPLFHLPKDQSVPILMVGPGTGIAPFRSFWMQRKYETRYSKAYYGSSYGEMFLYFGCRNATDDNIFVEELQMCERERTLTKCYFAFSREVGIRKTYVQDLLNRNGRDVYRKLIIENGHLYICGKVQMASDVKTMVRDIIMTLGGVTQTQADEYLDKMKNENRLHEDIFGVAIKKKRGASARLY